MSPASEKIKSHLRFTNIAELINYFTISIVVTVDWLCRYKHINHGDAYLRLRAEDSNYNCELYHRIKTLRSPVKYDVTEPINTNTVVMAQFCLSCHSQCKM